MRTESAQRGETGARRKTREVFRFCSAISRAFATILKGFYESMAGSSSFYLVQADVSYYLSANVSHSSIRGSVWMFDNDGIRHSVELE